MRLSSFLTLGCLLFLTAFSCPRGKPPRVQGVGPVPEAPTPWTGWFLLDQPAQSVPLAQGWDLTGAFDPDCYAADTSVTSMSIDNYGIRWSSGAGGSARLSLLERLGLSGAASKADSGMVQFDSVFISRSSGLAPIPNCSAANVRDQLPIRPAIAAVIGAKGYTFQLWSQSSSQLGLEAEGTIRSQPFGGNASIQSMGGNSRRVTFASARIIGVQLRGFEATSVDTFATGIAPIGTNRAIETIGWSARADTIPGSSGKYNLYLTRSAPPVRVDTVQVRHTDPFAFGRSGSGNAAGAFLSGAFYVGPQNDEFQVIVTRSAFATKEWPVAQRDSMIDWIRGRAAH